MDARNRFLLASLANLAVTANATKPIARQGGLSIPAFAWGLPTSELPVPSALFQAGSALVAGRGGGIAGWQGAVGLAANALSAAGLARIHRGAAEAEDLLEAALVEELGAGYRDRIREPFSLQPDMPITRRRLVQPQFGLARRYRSARNLPYGAAGMRNHLDVWRRSDLPADGKAPVVFQVHGGAWVTGSKEQQAQPLLAHLAERGWVCVTTNYRLGPRATWPDQVVDIKKALAWVKATVAEHGGDPDFVVITGGSAGGHLSSLVALTPDVAEFAPGFEDADLSVAAAVPFYGIYDFVNRHGTGRADLTEFLERMVFKTRLAEDRDAWELASTISHLRADAPPFFVLHGTNDSLVPVEAARTFVDELRKTSSQPVVWAELPGAQHAFEIFDSVRTNHTVHAVERFLAVVRSEHGGPTPAEAVADADAEVAGPA